MLDVNLIGPTAIGFWRTFLGALILFAWAAFTRVPLTLPRPVMFWALFAGAAFAGDLFCWHRSIFVVGAGMATILGNTQVFSTAILSYFFFKEKLSFRFFLAALTAIAGVVLLIGVGSNIEFTATYLRGTFFGILTGFFYAWYIIAVKSGGHRKEKVSMIVLMAWSSLFTAIFLAIVCAFETHPFWPPDTYSYIVLFSMALIPQAIGWWAISTSLPKMTGATGGLILLLQPVLATVWGAILFAEMLTPLQIVGMIVTLAAIFAGSVKKKARDLSIEEAV